MVSEEFRQNVSSGDLDTVRSALIDYLIIDRTFRKFDEALSYAADSLKIIEPFNNEPPFSAEPWGIDYLNQQKVALMMNFSAERIEHLKKVITTVLPHNTDKSKANESDSSFSNQRWTDSPVKGNTGKDTSFTSRTNSRTGRNIVSETPVVPNSTPSSNGANRSYSKSRKSTNGSKKTGSWIVSETPVSSNENGEKSSSEPDILGTALIVGGVAIAAVGLATVEPIVVGTGVVVAGAGVGVKVKNRR
ncbi:hypothetical protein [Blautia marasmi]|uniref:hypothetical protein n=1 Tax=Blautia marasmi TaxID=1917868 RepID=UPI000CF22955|nr:hypothetical protein [Blautia marasmi]